VTPFEFNLGVFRSWSFKDQLTFQSHGGARSTRFMRHIEPDPSLVQARRDSRAHPGILLRTIARKYFEPREALIYQLVLDSDKLEEERNQLATRQRKN